MGYGAIQERLQAGDLILLEMMYYPKRMGLAFEAALATGLPVWAGFSARRAEDGRPLSYTPERDIPFEQLVAVLKNYDAAGEFLRHASDWVADSVQIVDGCCGLSPEHIDALRPLHYARP